MSKVIRNSRGTGIDMQKCVQQAGNNRFNLVLLASARAREINLNNNSTKNTKENATVSALLEVQSGAVGLEYMKKIK
jgi:DNA-directed RNA polymerase omega subunit